jgi:CheY-like chemotaxis protein
VLDINLPQFSGLEVLEALRSSRDFHDVPVIIMTSSAQARERARAHGLGIDEFITKSPDLEEILQIGHVIKKLLLNRASTAKTNALPD